MKVFLVFSGSGTTVVLSNIASVDDPVLSQALASKGIEKYIAFEIPVALAKARYGHHFDEAEQELGEHRHLRVLDYNGERAMRLFRFDELGPMFMHEPPGYTELKSL
ncbi:MAG: hypothetical protein Kow0065_19710 [Methylomicrobium sp.]